ncbi:4-hydroxyphenylpyruvate dioxygenase [Candida viswanathii]|uniref:4-hydroxyphenylpyruvate dioxygenase n=1 Tax=Candida viswanathii TaxID=5486 RepID=A0A367XQZ4_9ASCO|nr:4-hydroxyphenylpyruvate dioxygenase [Candida viswanathii]
MRSLDENDHLSYSCPNDSQQTVTICPSAATIEATTYLDPIFSTELPFFTNDSSCDPLTTFTTEELLTNKFPITKYPYDGFINFHSLKICSSNAKQMSKYLQLAMDFSEIAYRGLETGSKLVGSHVTQNGSIILEIVNTLETIDDDNVLKFPYFQDDLAKFERFNQDFFMENFKLTTDDLIFDFVNNRIENLSINPDSSKLGKKFYKSIVNSKDYKESIARLHDFILNTVNNSEEIYNDMMECTLIQRFLKTHAEGVMDIAFNVNDVDTIFERAVRSGSGIIRLPKIISDENGSVKLATISIPNCDIQHTLIENINYTGPFLPGYSNPVSELSENFQLQLSLLPPVTLSVLDHCVENYSWNQMMEQARLYARIFGFHKYWSVDEEDISTGYTALRSIVMASSNGQIKMPINEPVKSKMKGQIEEFNDFNGGPGIQHIAFRTNNIVDTIMALIQRGIEFNHTSTRYYDNLAARLKHDRVRLYENFEVLRSLNILVDYDPSTRNRRTGRCNYMLQIFSKPLHDRPTLFVEIIQRHHHKGFGKGTFKGLFESIEEQQKLRGTFVESDP